MRIVVGIDPGINGGVAVLNEFDRLETAHLPLIESEIVGNMIDCAALARWISDRDATEAIVERAHAFPGQGVVSVFSYGMAFGQIIGVLQTLMLPITFVEPREWKKLYGLLNKKGEDKLPEDAPRQKARERFYLDDDTQFPLNKDIHRAEAALIADYALQRGT
jgi:crossover junction endodeoxyribonuclease RuvC